MKQHIYNVETQHVEHTFHDGYIVDGQPGVVVAPRVLPDDEQLPQPEYNPATHKVLETQTADLENGKLIHGWEFVELTEEDREAIRVAMPELDYAVFWIMLVRTPWNGVSFEQHVLDVYAAMEDGPAKKEMFYWMNNSKFRRTHPVLVGMAQQMGVTDAQMDAMWESAVAGI